MHDLGTLGGNYSAAFGINDHSQVVGSSAPGPGVTHAMIYDPTNGMVDLNTLIDPSLGWTLTSAGAINNAGDIVGTGNIIVDVPGHGPTEFDTEAFLLVPVPEPGSAVLCGLGAISCLTFAVLKRRAKRTGAT